MTNRMTSEKALAAVAAPGDALCSLAGAERRFTDFSDDLAARVVFCGPQGGASGT